MECIDHGVTKSRTRLSNSNFHAKINTLHLFLLHSSEKDLILLNRRKHPQRGCHRDQDGKNIVLIPLLLLLFLFT